MRQVLIISFVLSVGAGCAALSPSKGGGQVAAAKPRPANAAHVALPAGYRIEVVASDLNMPSGITFDEQNRPVIVEAGYSYGEVFAAPRLLRIEPDGRTVVLARGDEKFAPWNGVQYHGGAFTWPKEASSAADESRASTPTARSRR